MADFRKWILALTVLVLAAGLCSAQINGGSGATTNLVCTANAANPPQLRSEGYTELVGDITLNCVGGATPGSPGTEVYGSQIPVANVTVYLNQTVTSRLNGGSSNGNASEAMLLIDEPGASPNLGGYGPTAPLTVCTAALQSTNGCIEYVGNVSSTVANTVASNCNGSFCANVPVETSPCSAGVCTLTNETPGWNAWQGTVSGSSVTFFGVPILAPGTTGTRIFRITNVRLNANALTGGGPIPANAVAAVSISGTTALSLNNPQLTVGFATASLTTSLRKIGGGSFPSSALTQPLQCTEPAGNGNKFGQADLQYTENFGTAFKTRVQPGTPVAGLTVNPNGTGGTGQSGTAIQNIPGAIYNSESGFIGNGGGWPSINGTTAGLADFGTRLKAVFNNIPTGVSVYVSTTNIITTLVGPATASTSLAVLISAENAPENTASVTATGTTTAGGFSTTAAPGYYQLPIVNNSAEAVWEVVNTYPSLNESFEFSVWLAYTASPSTNSPPPGTMTVNMNYAPSPSSGLFTAAQGGAASSSLPIPRFADTSTAANLAQVTICQTALLFPFVTNTNGFDTGLAIANTSVDPFGTAAQAGTCTLNWYGNATTASNPAPSALGAGGVGSTAAIPGGVDVTLLASTTVPGFQGYMIAVCNFQFAHGFAFISDLGAQKLAMGYLALVMNSGGVAARPTGIAEVLEN